jgi:hypothetical protein
MPRVHTFTAVKQHAVKAQKWRGRVVEVQLLAFLNLGPRRRRRQLHAMASFITEETKLGTYWVHNIDGMDTALLRELQHHTAVVQPTVTIPTELFRLKKYAVQNEITSISRDTHTHTHTHTHDPYLVWRKSCEADEECYCFLQKMFSFCKSACKQFRVVTMNCLTSREGGFNKGNLRED